MYSYNTSEVFITPGQLESARKTVETLIHELAHHTSGAEDLSERHSGHMTWLASLVVKYTAKGEFDEELKGAEW